MTHLLPYRRYGSQRSHQSFSIDKSEVFRSGTWTRHVLRRSVGTGSKDSRLDSYRCQDVPYPMVVWPLYLV